MLPDDELVRQVDKIMMKATDAAEIVLVKLLVPALEGAVLTRVAIPKCMDEQLLRTNVVTVQRGTLFICTSAPLDRTPDLDSA